MKPKIVRNYTNNVAEAENPMKLGKKHENVGYDVGNENTATGKSIDNETIDDSVQAANRRSSIVKRLFVACNHSKTTHLNLMGPHSIIYPFRLHPNASLNRLMKRRVRRPTSCRRPDADRCPRRHPQTRRRAI